MAVYTSAATWLWSAGATWVGGIKPPSAWGHSIIIALTHVVTYDEAAWEYGDDTATAIVVNGTLKASRTVNTSLTCKWDFKTWNTTTATIDWWRRSISDPIPAWITATLILNYSAAMVNFKWGMYIADTSNAYFCGATKTINTYVITSNLAISATSAIVNDITGWAIGDNIIFAASDGNYSHWETKPITSITPGAWTTGTIWWATGLSYTHAINCPVWNRTSNVTVKNYDTATVGYVCFFHSSTASNNRREVDYTSFEYVGSNTALVSTKVFIASNTNAVTTPFVTFSNNFFFQCNQSSTLFIYLWNSNGFDMNNLGFFSTNGSFASNTYTAAWTFVKISNSVYYYNNGVNHVSAFSQGGQGCILSGNTYCSSASAHINNGNGDGLSVTNCRFHSASGAPLIQLSAWSANFTGCDFGSSALWGTPEFSYIVNAGTAPWQVFRGTMSDCKFWNPATSFYQNLTITNPSYILYVANKNLDPLIQEIYTSNGLIIRDNTSKISGNTSLKMSPLSATNALTFTLQIPAPNGKLVWVSWKLNRDTLNTATCTLSGLGITPSIYTASGAINTNETFFVSGTNNTGTDGILTLTISVTGTSGNMWVDNVSAPQASAIDFWEFWYWSGWLPTQLMTASFVSAGDVWNYLTSNITTIGSIGTLLKTNIDKKLSDIVWSGSSGYIRNGSEFNSQDRKIIQETHEKVLELQNTDFTEISQKLDEIDSHNILAKEHIIDILKETEIEICSDIIRSKKEIKEDNIATRNLVRQKTKKIDENTQKLVDGEEEIKKMIEDEANEIESDIEKILNEEADMIEKDREEQINKEADQIESEINSNQSNDGND